MHHAAVPGCVLYIAYCISLVSRRAGRWLKIHNAGKLQGGGRGIESRNRIERLRISDLEIKDKKLSIGGSKMLS